MAVSKRMRWYGPEVSKRIREAAAEGLWEAASTLLAASRELVPLQEGILSASGATDPNSPGGISQAGLTVNVFYDTDYAVKQHEDKTLNHAPGRQAKYLEQPAQQHARTLMDHVARRIREAHD